MTKQIFALHLVTQRFDFKVPITLARIVWASDCSSVTCLYANNRIKTRACHVILCGVGVATKLAHRVASVRLPQFIHR